jgi:hypothetical protein
MTRRRRWIVWSAVALVVLFLLWLAQRGLLDAIDRSMCKRLAGDARSIGTAVEEYKAEFGQYPVTMSVEDLRNAVTPTYIRDLPPGVRYFSDGSSYTVVIRMGDEGPIVDNCVFEYRDGELVSWPDYIHWE